MCIINISSFEFENSISILCLGDFHNGSEFSLFSKIGKVLDEQEQDYIIIVGDLIDAVTKNSVGDVYKTKKSIQDQIDETIAFITKYKNRILGIISGNHDRRINKEVGYDFLKTTTNMLNIPYSNDWLILDLNIKNSNYGSKKRINYTIALTHGHSGGRTLTSSSKQSEQLNQFIGGIDIFVSGHTHKPIIQPIRQQIFDRHNKKIISRVVYNIVVSSLLPTEEYALHKSLPPTPHVIPRITLFGGNKRKIKTEFFDHQIFNDLHYSWE